LSGARVVHVAVGTENELKVEAVRRVFRRYHNAVVTGVPTKMRAPKQPVGLHQLLAGAVYRAVAARSTAGADYGVGVEAGLVEWYSSTGFLETQLAVIVGPGMKASVGTSSSFELPPGIVGEMLGGTELSAASGICRGGDIGEMVGYIGVKSWGYTTRLELTEQAVLAALLPWIEGGEWLIRVDELARRAGIEDYIAGIEA